MTRNEEAAQCGADRAEAAGGGRDVDVGQDLAAVLQALEVSERRSTVGGTSTEG